MILIKGEGFILREFKHTDKDSLIKNINDKIIYDNTELIPYPYTETDANDWLNYTKNTKNIHLVIDIDGQVAGSISLIDIKDNHKAELGYWLGKDYRRKGIMTKALKLIIDYAFNELKLKKIFAEVFTFNENSCGLLEKCGFEKEAILKKNSFKDGIYNDDYIYSLISN
ncbi:GNAT family N-acetyltransferase [Candidatus Woesearchaeota archaeon]|nr:MAG: GNAT family N-acetyltransferase [Candidatus Woesearchaeota archaeon]